jgi:hypothetical protein
LLAGLDAAVAVSGQHLRVALAGHDGADDGLAGGESNARLGTGIGKMARLASCSVRCICV